MAGCSPDLAAADARMAPLVDERLLTEVLALVPDVWLADEPGFVSPDAVREAYLRHLLARVADRSWLPEVVA
jgi:hypothetical protein